MRLPLVSRKRHKLLAEQAYARGRADGEHLHDEAVTAYRRVVVERDEFARERDEVRRELQERTGHKPGAIDMDAGQRLCVCGGVWSDSGCDLDEWVGEHR